MSMRTQYSEETKAIVAAKYPHCRSPEDRERLAAELGIDSVQKLYNLASRLGSTRPHNNSSREWTGDSDDAYDATEDSARLYLRDPLDIAWSEDDERYLIEHFGRYTMIETIAFMLNRSETTTAYHARILGLRQVPKYYDIKKVAPWLGLTYREIFLLNKRGLEIYPCTDSRGKLTITLISTVSLARVLLKDRLWKHLVDNYNADMFFIKDVIESIVALQKGEASWEPNCWVSHGHTCLNPFSDSCFGLFYDGNDANMAGEDLVPSDLSPRANVQSDNWRRGIGQRLAPDSVSDDADAFVMDDRERTELSGAGLIG